MAKADKQNKFLKNSEVLEESPSNEEVEDLPCKDFF